MDFDRLHAVTRYVHTSYDNAAELPNSNSAPTADLLKAPGSCEAHLNSGNLCVTIRHVRSALLPGNRWPQSFEEWFSDLDAAAGAKVAVAVARLEQCNLSNAKAVGEGVLEYRIDWGPEYRIYFGQDGNVLVILLTGGTKQRQRRDIETAKAPWADYKRRKPRRR